MKLSDFSLLEEDEWGELAEQIKRLNQTRTEYPRHKTVGQLFAEQTGRTPQAPAVLYNGQTITYQQLEDQANQLAHFLHHTGRVRPETFVGVMLDRSINMVIAILAIIKAGGAYVPLNPNLPVERLKYMLMDSQTPLLIGEKKYIRLLNQLQWECPTLTTLYCLDSPDITQEIEPDTAGMMDSDMWAYIAEQTFDDISGGGWKSSYTGEWLSREVMDEYGDNIRRKLQPLLKPTSKVLEIGVASGISMFRLAPLVGHYVGTDLSAGIIQWSGREAEKRGLTNIQLYPYPAHETFKVPEKGFDVVIINSVVECFPGHNYFREVLRQAFELLNDEGVIFLGNVWDQEQKEAFVASLLEYKRANPAAHTKVDRSGELFISRAFLQDLQADFPFIQQIEFSTMLGTAESELSRFGFDALLHLHKGKQLRQPAERHKWQFDQRAVKPFPTTPLEIQTRPDNLIYLIYTSGSTGKPKGVMVEHKSVVRLVMNTNYVQFGPEDCVLQTGALAFDASTFEIWGPLLNGGRVCLPEGNSFLAPHELGRLIRENGVTTIFLTTGLFNQLVESDLGIFATLNVLFTGGEKVSVRHINLVHTTYPNLVLNHVYGPTENTTYTTCYRVTAPHEHDVPIGRPLANSTVYILDDHLRPVPIGTAGELCTGGDGLARGYLNDPELTAKKFVTHPFEPTERIYRTGDLARQLPDGNVEFLGRLDNQVKIRGYRIEPEEVELAVHQQEGVKEAAVLVKNRPDGSKCLVAYYSGQVTAADLRENLKRSLPEYMLPAFLVHLEQLPLNSSGKVHRQALPEPVFEEDESHYTAPATATEKALVAIWEEVLGRPRLSVTEDFFDAGGHSLTVTKLISLIQQKLNVTLPLTAVFKYPTVRQLAPVLLESARFGQAIADEPLVLLNGQTAGKPLFAFPPGTGDALGFIQLAELLQPTPVYALNFIEADNRLAQYADLVEQTDPAGDFILFGYSSGGNLAYQVAHELEKRGRKVQQVIMVDSSRKLAVYQFGEEQIMHIAGEFLNHDSIKPYLTSPVLVEKVLRQIQHSYAVIEQSVDSHTIRANITVLLCEGSAAEYHDETGRLLASTAAWAEATSGTFRTVQGVGSHINMLYPPHLTHNVALIKQIMGE